MIIFVIMVMVMMMMIFHMILMMMMFQWRVDGSVDIPTQDPDLRDEPINEAVSRSALGTREKGGGGDSFWHKYFLTSSSMVELYSGKGLKAYSKNRNHE